MNKTKRRAVPKFEITGDKEQIKQLIKQINKSTNVSEICELISQLDIHISGYPKCKICGKPLYFQEMLFSTNGRCVTMIKPIALEHTFEQHTFKLCHCYDCIKNHFADDMPSMQRYLFQLRYRWAKFAFDIPEDIHKEIRSDMCGVTPKTLIRKHGEEEGMKIWKEYCRKQSETNTFEHKQKMYGWTKEQFDEYNKSRAVTKENLIQRHGEEEGMKIWNNYVAEQKRTKSWDYMVEKFGEEKATEINKSKALTLSNFIKKYGKDEGEQRYYSWLSKEFENNGQRYYSEVSQELFRKLDDLLPNYKHESKFFTKNKEYIIEYSVNDETRVYMLDYYIPSLKVCVEFDGDLWHANPNKYAPTDKPFKFLEDITAQQIWEADKRKQSIVESQGIRVIRIWESDYHSKDFDINKLVDEILGKK